MAIKSLMHYFVFMSDLIPTHRRIFNVFFRGLCPETSDPQQFCRSPDAVTMTQAAFLVPLGILIILFVPTILYVTVVSVWNAKKGMRVIDHATLFIFPIFTNLCFNFRSDISETAPKSVSLELQARRSHSTPNISKSANKGAPRKRFYTLINMQTLTQVCFHRQLGISRVCDKEATARVLTFPQQYPLCILLCRLTHFHSNNIYAFFFVG